MANYYGTTRTNYFAVKNPVVFLEEMNSLPCMVIHKDLEDGTRLYGILDSNDDGGGLPWDVWDDETEDYKQIDWLEIFSRHLEDDHVAVLMEIGSEKYRYLTGYAIAVNNRNEQLRIDLDDIYSLAETLGKHVTQATY